MKGRSKAFNTSVFFEITGPNASELRTRRRHRRHRVRGRWRVGRGKVKRGLILKVIGLVVQRNQGIKGGNG